MDVPLEIAFHNVESSQQAENVFARGSPISNASTIV